MSGRPMLALAAVVVSCAPVLAQIEIRDLSTRPVRTFPEFVGTWILDEAASRGRLTLTPRPARTLAIATTPTDISITKILRLIPNVDRPDIAPQTEVYKFDGSDAVRQEGLYEHRYRFTLVADALALTIRTQNWQRAGDPLMSQRNAFTAVTDAYSVDGDVLTVHRQLTSVSHDGAILEMSNPANGLRHTYVYRRAP